MDEYKLSGLFILLTFVFLIVGMYYWGHNILFEIYLAFSTISLFAAYLFYFIMRFNDIDNRLDKLQSSIKDKRRIV